MARPLGFIPRAAQRDPNEKPIMEALRKAGCLVTQLNGKGIPDLLVGVRGRFVLLEVKQPKGKKGGQSKAGQRLRETQRAFFIACEELGLPAYVARSPEEALRRVGLLDIEHRFDFSDEGGT